MPQLPNPQTSSDFQVIKCHKIHKKRKKILLSTERKRKRNFRWFIFLHIKNLQNVRKISLNCEFLVYLPHSCGFNNFIFLCYKISIFFWHLWFLGGQWWMSWVKVYINSIYCDRILIRIRIFIRISRRRSIRLRDRRKLDRVSFVNEKFCMLRSTVELRESRNSMNLGTLL